MYSAIIRLENTAAVSSIDPALVGKEFVVLEDASTNPVSTRLYEVSINSGVYQVAVMDTPGLRDVALTEDTDYTVVGDAETYYNFGDQTYTKTNGNDNGSFVVESEVFSQLISGDVTKAFSPSSEVLTDFAYFVTINANGDALVTANGVDTDTAVTNGQLKDAIENGGVNKTFDAYIVYEVDQSGDVLDGGVEDLVEGLFPSHNFNTVVEFYVDASSFFSTGFPIFDLAESDGILEITAAIGNEGQYIISMDDSVNPPVFTAYPVSGDGSSVPYTVDLQNGLTVTMDVTMFDGLMAEAQTNGYDTVADPFPPPPAPTNPIVSAVFNSDGSELVITFDSSITSEGDAISLLFVDSVAVTSGAGVVWNPGDKTLTLTGSADDYNGPSVVVWDTDDNGTLTDGGDFTVTATAATPPPATPDSAYDKDVFEIVRVGLDEGPNGSGGRFGKIETFGIRLMDDGDVSTTNHTFTNVDLVIEWEQGEYMFWGNYQPGTVTPIEDSESFTNSLVLDDISTITQNPLATEMNLSFFDSSSSVTYAEGDYLATFMIERLDTSGAVENYITLDTSRYNYDSDATVDDPFPLTRSPDPVDFDFGYAAHDVDIKLANARAEEAHNPKLFVSNGSISDGLSIVPVAKLGHFVKYEVVLNISRPTFIDTGASVASAQAIEIYGAQIFEESVLDLTGLATGQTAETLGSNNTVTIHDGDSVTPGATVASTTIVADADLKGHEFFEIAARALDPDDTGYTEDDLGSVDSLYLSFTDLTKPTSVAADGSDAEGRYVMAEFVAYSSDGPDIKFKSGKEIESQMVFGDPIEITHRGDYVDAVAAADPTTIVGGDNDGDYTTYWTESVADGSDIALLGEGFYENPETYEDAIGAEDALAALIIANDAAGDTYDQSQIIAADFNESGDVNSADAYDILHYALFGAQDGGATPKWVYIDDVESGTSTGGTSSSVDYDRNIDLFVGGAVEIDATAVLIGDVSESYESLGEHAPINEYMWYFESFMHREYVTIDASGQTPILEDADGTYDNVDANGDTNAAGALVALDGVPEWFTLVGDSTAAAPITISDIEWGFGNDVVILSLDTPDNYDRVKLDIATTDTPAGLAADFFEAGSVNALMLDKHDGEAPTGEQILIVDSNMDGALGDTDFMMVFQGVDKNAFDDEYSIIYDGAIA